MLKAREEANQLIFWDICHGQINFWRDHWYGDSNLSHLLELDYSPEEWKVADLWSGGSWDRDKLQLQHIEEPLLTRISHTRIHDAMKDRMVIKGLKPDQSITKLLSNLHW